MRLGTILRSESIKITNIGSDTRNANILLQSARKPTLSPESGSLKRTFGTFTHTIIRGMPYNRNAVMSQGIK